MPSKSLKFEGVHLGELSVDTILPLIRQIPSDVEELSLCNNELHKLSDDDLRSVLSALHEGLKKLDLSGNGLVSKSDAKYKGIVSATPSSIVTIALAGHCFLEKSRILAGPEDAWGMFHAGVGAEFSGAAGEGKASRP